MALLRRVSSAWFVTAGSLRRLVSDSRCFECAAHLSLHGAQVSYILDTRALPTVGTSLPLLRASSFRWAFSKGADIHLTVYAARQTEPCLVAPNRVRERPWCHASREFGRSLSRVAVWKWAERIIGQALTLAGGFGLPGLRVKLSAQFFPAPGLSSALASCVEAPWLSFLLKALGNRSG
jgi:hypothetical protein